MSSIVNSRMPGIGIETKMTGDIEQGLLDVLAGHRVPTTVIAVMAVVVSINYGRVPTWMLAVWAVAILGTQATRAYWFPKLARTTGAAVGERIRIASRVSLLNGLVFSSAVCFFPYVDEISRAIHTMIIIGMVAGSVATTSGYGVTFRAFTIPVMLTGALGWMLSPTTAVWYVPYAIALLIGLMTRIFLSVADANYDSFVKSYKANAALSRAYEQLKIANEALQRTVMAEQNASAAKTRFLASASHDLRQPLNTLSMLSAALAMRPLDDKSASIAGNINEAMSDLSGELDTLLDISKLDAGVMHLEPRTFNMGAAVARVAGPYRAAAAKKGINLVVNEHAKGRVCTDKAMFDRVSRNLIDNAIKYTNQGEVLVEVSEHDGRAVLGVKDTGIGISPDDQRQIFEEFFQVKNPERDRRKGLGLGLSIVSRLVDILGGRIHLESEVGVGTRFVVDLPIATSVIDHPEPKPLGPSDLTDVKVLVVDDDPSVRMGLRTLLEQLGCQVNEADGTAKATLVAQESLPDVALVDIRLPGDDDGFKVVAGLRRVRGELPIIFLSGETSPNQLQEADRLGLTLLIKPATQTQIAGEISRAIRLDS